MKHSCKELRVTQKHFSLFVCLITILWIFSDGEASERFTINSDNHKLKGTVCKPNGAGPFPVVVYHHGGAGRTIGGAPKATCEALAKDGFVGVSLLRRQTQSLRGHVNDADAAVVYAKKLSYVDSNRIGIIGFSRGGLLAYQQATKRTDLSAVIIMAVAVNRQLNFRDASKINTPILVLVAENDTGSSRTKGRNTIRFSRQLANALEQAGSEVKLIVLPPFEEDGHTLFFEIRTEYWSKLVKFLKLHLKS